MFEHGVSTRIVGSPAEGHTAHLTFAEHEELTERDRDWRLRDRSETPVSLEAPIDRDGRFTVTYGELPSSSTEAFEGPLVHISGEIYRASGRWFLRLTRLFYLYPRSQTWVFIPRGGGPITEGTGWTSWHFFDVRGWGAQLFDTPLDPYALAGPEPNRITFRALHDCSIELAVGGDLSLEVHGADEDAIRATIVIPDGESELLFSNADDSAYDLGISPAGGGVGTLHIGETEEETFYCDPPIPGYTMFAYSVYDGCYTAQLELRCAGAPLP